jgi:hypothetical protein
VSPLIGVDFFHQIGNRITRVLSAHTTASRMNRMVSPILPSLGKSVLLVRKMGTARRAVAPPSLPHAVTGRRFPFFEACVAKTRSA